MPASIELWVYGAMTGELLTMARVVLQSTSCGCRWLPVGTSAGTGLPVGWFPATNPHSHWLEVLQAKAFIALTWEVLRLNGNFWNVWRPGYSGDDSTFNGSVYSQFFHQLFILTIPQSDNCVLCTYPASSEFLGWWYCLVGLSVDSTLWSRARHLNETKGPILITHAQRQAQYGRSWAHWLCGRLKVHLLFWCMAKMNKSVSGLMLHLIQTFWVPPESSPPTWCSGLGSKILDRRAKWVSRSGKWPNDRFGDSMSKNSLRPN